MKNSLILFLVFILSASCKKNESPQPSRSNTIQAEINGVNWSARVDGYVPGFGDLVKIFSETKPDGTSMQLFMREDTTGVFDVSEDIAILVYNDSTNDYAWNISGTITLLHNSANKVEGSFDLKAGSVFATDTLEFKQGSFYWSK